jgi:hypothetical protein
VVKILGELQGTFHDMRVAFVPKRFGRRGHTFQYSTRNVFGLFHLSFLS